MNESFIQIKQKPAARARRQAGQPARRGPKRDPGKLKAIAGAACHVLTAQGLRLTQVADVAAVAGVAAGTVYTYVAEKEALVELAIRSAARLELPKGETAVRHSPARLKRVTAEAVAMRFQWPVLTAALSARARRKAALIPVLEETYDMLARERRLIALLDRCAQEVRVVEDLYLWGLRRSFLGDFETYIRLMARAGHLRRDIDTAAAARGTLEMMVWMAMRRVGDPEPPACDEEAARKACIALAASGLKG